MRFASRYFAALVLAALLFSSADAQINIVEPSAGFFSTDNLDPTPLGTMAIGVNTVAGSVSNARNGSATTDVFSFDIPSGTQLDSIFVTDYVTSTDISFVGLDTGNSFPHDAAGLDAVGSGATYLAIGGGTFNATSPPNGTPPALFSLTEDYIFAFAQGFGGPVASAPLQAGTYTMYVQETAGSASTYEFTYNVSAIPEPSSFAALSIVGAIATMRRRRRS